MTDSVEIAPGISVNAGVRHGKPVVKGTRVPVSLVLGQLSAGVTHEELKAEYGLTDEGIRAALAYAAELVAHETVRVG